MEPLSSVQMTVILLLATLIANSVNLVHGQQVSSSCTTSMMSSFTPCANIVTGSTNNGLVPSTTCCDSLRSLMSTNMDCACQIMSANAPFFQQSINQVLALSLSQACNINGFNMQCEASSTPLPAAGPAVVESNSPTLPPVASSPLSPQGPAVVGSDSPTLPPVAASPLSPQVSKTVVVADAYKYKYENMQLAQAQAPAAASSPMEAEAPPKTPGIRPVLTSLPSASHPSHVSFSPSALILIGIVVFGIH